MATLTATGAEDVAWDLSDLYDGPADARIDADLAGVAAAAARFVERYRGAIASVDAAGLAEALVEREHIGEVFARITAFANLSYSADTGDAVAGALVQRISEEGARLAAALVFFDLEWLALADERAEALAWHEALTTYRHHLLKSRLRKPHVLTEAEERLLAELEPAGPTAWRRLFTEINASMRVPIDGEELSAEQALALLQRPDRDVRRRAAEAFTQSLSSTLRARARITNTLALDKATKDRVRGYPNWLSSRNLDNEASDASVQALIDAVVARYDIPHRFYALKARVLGLDRLADYDRSAPFGADGVTVSWDEARDTVQRAYDGFSPVTGGIVRDFFERRWIDAAPRENKTGGAFCWTTLPGAHPYMLMTYTGERRSVLTLAHELGHGVHGALTGRRHGLLNSSVPLTLAETASVFGEALTFTLLLRGEDDPERRLRLLAGRLDDTVATVFRQIAMNRFEDAVHTARRERGELSIEDLSGFWTSTQTDVLGPSVEVTPGYTTWWSAVPHFLHTPGYVYAYAFGYLFSLAIFRRYEREGDALVDPYLELLSSGGSAPPEELARIVGIDLADPGFWAQGLGAVDELLSEAEALAGTS